MCVNDTFRKVPFADVHYFADAKWWEWHKDKEDFKAFAGERATIFCTAAVVGDPEIHMVHSLGSEGMSDDPSGICTGSNSGHQVLNIAYLTGATKIILTGYDAQALKGKTHFFGDHPDNSQAPYGNMVHNFNAAAPFFKERGVRVINATRITAIKAFPRMTLLEALAA